MGDASQSGLKPPPEFQEDTRAPVIEPNTTDSTELWLIQWPKDQIPDLNGQQISLNLHNNDGQLGTFKASSEKSYDVVSLTAQEPKAMVFLSSGSDSKIVGKITRRVSFVRYLEADEVPKDDTKKLKQMYERSNATSLTNSGYQFTTPAKSSKRTSTHASVRKSSLSAEKSRSKDLKPAMSLHDSDHSNDKKSNKKKKHVA